MSHRPVNATDADIIAMLHTGASNIRISGDLRCDKQRVARIRGEIGLPTYLPVTQTRTIEQKWALFVRPVDGGHLEWAGERATSSRTPLLRYRDRQHSAAGVAFRIKHGHPPEGYVIADCGVQHCVAPDHVNDEAGRLAAREKLRITERKPFCLHGHDQSEHGRYEPDGTAYCEACKRAFARGEREPRRKPDLRPEIASMLREGVQEYLIARRLHVGAKTVAAVRVSLGLPAPHCGRRSVYASIEDAFLARAESLGDGHCRWPGKTSSDGVPVVKHRGVAESAYRVAFRAHYGRAPEGLVKPACEMPRCVSGWHLEDRIVRERTEAAYAALLGAAA